MKMENNNNKKSDNNSFLILFMWLSLGFSVFVSNMASRERELKMLDKIHTIESTLDTISNQTKILHYNE